MVEVKTQKLVSVSGYARYFKIDRKTVYRLLEKGKLTRYEDQEGNPMLSLAEKPRGVKRYKGFRKRKTT